MLPLSCTSNRSRSASPLNNDAGSHESVLTLIDSEVMSTRISGLNSIAITSDNQSQDTTLVRRISYDGFDENIYDSKQPKRISVMQLQKGTLRQFSSAEVQLCEPKTKRTFVRGKYPKDRMGAVPMAVHNYEDGRFASEMLYVKGRRPHDSPDYGYLNPTHFSSETEVYEYYYKYVVDCPDYVYETDEYLHRCKSDDISDSIMAPTGYTHGHWRSWPNGRTPIPVMSNYSPRQWSIIYKEFGEKFSNKYANLPNPFSSNFLDQIKTSDKSFTRIRNSVHNNYVESRTYDIHWKRHSRQSIYGVTSSVLVYVVTKLLRLTSFFISKLIVQPTIYLRNEISYRAECCSHYFGSVTHRATASLLQSLSHFVCTLLQLPFIWKRLLFQHISSYFIRKSETRSMSSAYSTLRHISSTSYVTLHRTLTFIKNSIFRYSEQNFVYLSGAIKSFLFRMLSGAFFIISSLIIVVLSSILKIFYGISGCVVGLYTFMSEMIRNMLAYRNVSQTNHVGMTTHDASYVRRQNRFCLCLLPLLMLLPLPFVLFGARDETKSNSSLPSHLHVNDSKMYVDCDNCMSTIVKRLRPDIVNTIKEEIKLEMLKVERAEKKYKDEIVETAAVTPSIDESKIRQMVLAEVSKRITSLRRLFLTNRFKSESELEKIILSAILKYDADKTSRPDYALESIGGSVYGTRCTDTHTATSPYYYFWGFKLWMVPPSVSKVIQPSVRPGECWPFVGAEGQIILKLAKAIYINGVSVEHIPKSLSPNNEITSAPKDFVVEGLHDPDAEDSSLLGSFQYGESGLPVQTFDVTNVNTRFRFVKFHFKSNWGHPEYTCIYRIRVHGVE